MSSIVIGLLIGYAAAFLTGAGATIASLLAVNNPLPFCLGLSFNWGAFISFAVVYVATAVECIGDMTATCMVTGEPIKGSKYFRQIKAGILGDGVNSLIASVLSTFPNTSMSQNNGLIKLTGVGSRYVGYFIAGILVILGFFLIIGGILRAIPAADLGGATILMYGSVAVAGMNILRTIEMDVRNSVVASVAFALALGVRLPQII